MVEDDEPLIPDGVADKLTEEELNDVIADALRGGDRESIQRAQLALRILEKKQRVDQVADRQAEEEQSVEQLVNGIQILLRDEQLTNFLVSTKLVAAFPEED